VKDFSNSGNMFPPVLKHDFKNMLNPVINLSSVLLKTAGDRLSPDEITYLEIILKNAREMLEIIDETPGCGKKELHENGSDVSMDNSSMCNRMDMGNEKYVMLVIDDDPDNLISVRAIMEYDFDNMFNVIHAGSGREGIDILSGVKPDIILLDINLPDISGLILVKSIKNYFAGGKVPVIAFTALDVNDYRSRLLSAGFDDIIPKPFEIESFVEKIKKWSGEKWL